MAETMTQMRNRRKHAQGSPPARCQVTATSARAAIDTGGAGVMALSSAPPVQTTPPRVVVTSAARFAAPPEQVFAFHADVRNLPRLTPGPARILSAPVPTRGGDLQVIELGVPPFALQWHARVTRFEPPHTLADEQARGPFRHWRHIHAVVPVRGGSLLVDTVEFALLPGRLGRLLDRLVVGAVLRLLFVERHRRTRRLLQRPARR